MVRRSSWREQWAHPAVCARERLDPRRAFPFYPQFLTTQSQVLLTSLYKKSRLVVKNVLKHHSTIKPPTICAANILIFERSLKCCANLC